MGYDAIVFSAGGSRGICQLGAMHAIRTRTPGKVRNTKFFIGSSVGSITAAIEAMSLDPHKLFEEEVLPFKYHARYTQVLRMFGIESSKSLETFISRVIPDDITFKSIHDEYGTVLSVIASNVTRKSIQIFDPIRTPEFRVSEALRISCSIPLIFPAIVLNDEILVDGALVNAFPVDIARDVYGCQQILGLTFEIEQYRDDNERLKLHTFIGSLVDLMVNSNTYIHKRGVDVVRIKTPADISGLMFDLNNAEKHALFSCGVDSAVSFFDIEQKNIDT